VKGHLIPWLLSGHVDTHTHDRLRYPDHKAVGDYIADVRSPLWLRGTVVERRSLAGELSCPALDL